MRAAIYSGGNPVFPIATSVLPHDHWTAAQSRSFDLGHTPREDQRSLSARLNALADGSLLAEDFFWIGQTLRALNVPFFTQLEGGYSKDLPELVLAYLKGVEGK